MWWAFAIGLAFAYPIAWLRNGGSVGSASKTYLQCESTFNCVTDGTWDAVNGCCEFGYAQPARW
jgi:hypothetical protein